MASNRSRSRSPVPTNSSLPQSRTRSRSPSHRKPRGAKGFRWKERPRRDDSDAQERPRDRDVLHDRHGQRSSRDSAQPREPRSDTDSRRTKDTSLDINSAAGEAPDQNSAPPKDQVIKQKEKKNKSSKLKPTSNEPMIIVNINDRLGTKAAIPCLASDSILLFKAQVAARIGRKPHEIMLKRQGERPMKDFLTLEDYGVSNGVQLDLELDTGD